VDLADGFENHVPVGAAEVCGGAETSDGVLFGVGVVDHDVGCVVGLDLCGEVLMDKLVFGHDWYYHDESNLRCGSQCGHRHLGLRWLGAAIGTTQRSQNLCKSRRSKPSSVACGLAGSSCGTRYS
jgi:hypothetical protein